jgi:hypothetical protein
MSVVGAVERPGIANRSSDSDAEMRSELVDHVFDVSWIAG